MSHMTTHDVPYSILLCTSYILCTPQVQLKIVYCKHKLYMCYCML